MNANKNFLIIAITAAISIIMIFSVLFYIPGFTQKKEKQIEKKTVRLSDTIITGKLPKSDTTLLIDKHSVYIKTCKKQKKGTFLVLHGWNLPAEDWCTKTNLRSIASANGYCVVLPDMGKSIYQEKNYPETRVEWRCFPTRQWLRDTLIPMLQKKYALLLKNENNYIVGLSTGARGVALILLDLPDLFKGAAALSGDYNQLKLPADNLMTGYYGPIAKFRDRWENTDNPIMRIKEYKTPIYLGHGKLDKVVPPEQTTMFYDSLKKYHPALSAKLNMPDANHDYTYWSSEVDNIFKFFGILK
jgi:S-formylglutathione hydrolase FrmB